MAYPVLMKPWPARDAALRLVGWREYLEDPTVGLIVDPTTGKPYGDLITAVVEVLELTETGKDYGIEPGQVVEVPLVDFLALEAQPRDVDHAAQLRLLRWIVKRRPPPVFALPGSGSPRPTLEDACEFLVEVLLDGPVPRHEVQAEADACGIGAELLFRARNRLRIVALTGAGGDDERESWRLRMSHAFALRRQRE